MRITLRDFAFYRQHNPYSAASGANSPPAVEPVKPVTPVSPLARAAQIQRVKGAREKLQHEKRDTLAYTIQTVSLNDIAHLPVVVAQFPLVRSLDLRRCKIVTDEAFRLIAQLHELEHLNIRGCRGVAVDLLTSLSSLAFLRQIDARNCPGLTEELRLGAEAELPQCVIRFDD